MHVPTPSASSRLHTPVDATVAAVARAHCPILPAGINSATVADSAVLVPIPVGGEQKVNGLPSGIRRSIQILVLTLDLDVRLVDPTGLVDRLQIRTAASVQLG